MNYEDGCKEGGPSCLTCRLPVCKYDDRAVVHRLRWEKRRREYVRAMDRGMTVGETARSYGVSERTVYRVLASAQKEEVDG